MQDAAALKEALDAALGTLVVVDKRRRLLLWEGVRIHLDTVDGLGSFLELEGVAPEDSDLSGERDRVARLSEALGLDETRILADSYSDRLLGAGGRRGADRRARARRCSRPTRRTRATGSASRCARPTARCTSAPTSRTPPTRSATAPRRRRSARWSPPATRRIVEAAVIGDGEEPCVPCGGCRQRLREFMPLDATVHLLADKGARATMTLEELLPRSFGPEYLP